MSDPGSVSPALILGIYGHPLTQSLSPMLHTWALAREGIAGTYTAWDTQPEDLGSLIRTFRETPCDGGSVTIPHKEAIIPLIDGLTGTARTIGAVNTLFRDNGKLKGHNTDLEGFIAPLKDLPKPGTALLLGAGGAARAVLAGFAALGLSKVTVAARSKNKTAKLLADFSPSFQSLSFLPWEEARLAPPASEEGFWVVNATPLGMRGKAEGESPLSASWFAAAHPERCLAYDLVYNPLETAFLAFAKNAGWQCRDGLDMFVGQAAAQFHLWTGRDMDTSAAHALLADHLSCQHPG